MSCNHDGSCAYVEVVDPESYMEDGLARAVAAFGPPSFVENGKPRFGALWCVLCGTLTAFRVGLDSPQDMKPLLVLAAEQWSTLRNSEERAELLRAKLRGDEPTVPLADDSRGGDVRGGELDRAAKIQFPNLYAQQPGKVPQSWAALSEKLVTGSQCPKCQGRLRKMPFLADGGKRSVLVVCDGGNSEPACNWRLYPDSLMASRMMGKKL